ncbi:MAG: hypothetical protein ACRBBW_16140 [Cellvibrionaceae bacterium]
MKTRDFNLAKRLWAALDMRWKQEIEDSASTALLNKLGNLSLPKDKGRHITLSSFLTEWREDILGYRKNLDGAVTLGPCYVLAQRGSGRGKPIAEPTRKDYGSDCLQLEKRTESDFPLSDPEILEKTRALLAHWLTKPTHYNGLRNTLTRALAHAVQTGVIRRNLMRDIEKIVEPKREVQVPNEAYVAITTTLMQHSLNRRTFNGEWRVKICDLIYMFSQQPIDVFALQEENLKLDLGAHGEIHFARHKTKNVGQIEMNKELRELVEWFRNQKRDQKIISPYLMVYPRYMDMRSRGKPVKHRTIGKWWADACVECGYTTTDHEGKTVALYQLRDLRKRGLTDEALKAGGATNKGIHDTEAMRNHYVLVTPPKRAVSTLVSIRDQ